MRLLTLMPIAASLLIPMTVPTTGAAAWTVAPARNARFDAFFTRFRAAVLAGDRAAVASMTRFPFVDARAGRSCEPGNAGCTVEADTLTSRDRAAFLANYDRIFTPEVIASIRERRVRAFVPGSDDGEVGGPLTRGEYLIDAVNTDAQRVFVPEGAGWKLARVPFYS